MRSEHICFVFRNGTIIVADDADKDGVAEAWKAAVGANVIREVQWIYDSDLRVHNGSSLQTFSGSWGVGEYTHTALSSTTFAAFPGHSATAGLSVGDLFSTRVKKSAMPYDAGLRTRVADEVAALFMDRFLEGVDFWLVGGVVNTTIWEVLARHFPSVLAHADRQTKFATVLQHVSLAIERLMAQAVAFADPAVPYFGSKCKDQNRPVFSLPSEQEATCQQLGAGNCIMSDFRELSEERFRENCPKTCDPECIRMRKHAADLDLEMAQAAKKRGGIHRRDSTFFWDSSFQRCFVEALGTILSSLVPATGIAARVPKTGPIIDASEVTEAAAALETHGVYMFSPRGNDRSEFWQAVRSLQRWAEEGWCQRCRFGFFDSTFFC